MIGLSLYGDPNNPTVLLGGMRIGGPDTMRIGELIIHVMVDPKALEYAMERNLAALKIQ